jgi:hypothetical protein
MATGADDVGKKPWRRRFRGVATAMMTVIIDQKALTGRPSDIQALMPPFRFSFNWPAGSAIDQSFLTIIRTIMNRILRMRSPSMSAANTAQQKEAFARKLTDVLNYGALNLAMGMGYRTRLFDVMDTMEKPASAEEIAEHAALDARYVKEWLGVMVCGGVVTFPGRRRGGSLPSAPGTCRPDYATGRQCQSGGLYPGDTAADPLRHG